MAFQMSFTDKGITAAQSYWKLAQTNFDHVSKTGLIVFNGYFNAAARTADPVQNVIAQHQYAITQEMYEEYYTESADLRAQSYVLAQATVEGAPPAEGEEDERVSFFDGAENV